MKLLKIYWFALLATIIIWTLAGVTLGLNALFTVVVLTVLETTFSADNAIINSKVLVKLSPLWQKLFMTIGIFIAVFLVRFLLPIFIVMISSGLDAAGVVNLAMHDAQRYAEELHQAEPLINAFGGAFLLITALSYFIDYEKETHWFKFLERRLGKLGKYDNITTFIMLVSSIVLYFTVEDKHQGVVLIAAICAMALHSGLELLNATFEKTRTNTAKKVGMAAFASFLYLEVLDASFSLDGVIGAFALTSNVILIIAGLGAGAVWVRAMTIHLIQSQTLAKYQYLEHGAHWAIGFLGGIMLLKLYHIEPPDWLVGSLGIVFIVAAILASRFWQRQTVSNPSTH